MRCQHTDFHADAYPEFAPDPIEVQCTEEATNECAMYYSPSFVAATEGPDAPITELFHLCDLHSEQFIDGRAEDGELARSTRPL